MVLANDNNALFEARQNMVPEVRREILRGNREVGSLFRPYSHLRPISNLIFLVKAGGSSRSTLGLPTTRHARYGKRACSTRSRSVATLLKLSSRSLRYYLKKHNIKAGDKSGEYPAVE